VLPVAPTLSAHRLGRNLATHGELHDPKLGLRVVLVASAQAALAHARAAVVASGTATVQAALAGTPFVMVYRVAASSYLLGRWMVRVRHFAMPNLIAGRRIVPELVQREFTAENVVRELCRIIPDSSQRTQLISGLAEVRAKLSSPQSSGGVTTAVDRAAAAVMKVIEDACQPVP